VFEIKIEGLSENEGVGVVYYPVIIGGD